MAQLSEDLLTLKSRNETLESEKAILKDELKEARKALKKVGGKEDVKALLEENEALKKKLLEISKLAQTKK